MRLLLIRHGAPDYEHDCLTPLGQEQAEKLAERLMRDEKISAVYASPMGRAQETAQHYVKRSGQSIVTREWLREFHVHIKDCVTGESVVVWDMYPKNWTGSTNLYDKDGFGNAPELEGSDMYERYTEAASGLDELLAEQGLIREGGIYRKTADTDKTVAIFCHFGISCVMAAHLLGVSPMLTLNGFSAEPTAVSVFCTDDRFGDEVNFRLHSWGDISHLDEKGRGRINSK